MKKLFILSGSLFLVACGSTHLYHPKHGRVNMDNKYLDADMTYCTKKVKNSGYKNMDAFADKVADCLIKKGWRP